MAKRKRTPTEPTSPAQTAYAHALELLAAGRREEAEGVLQRTLELDPRHGAAHNALGVLSLERGRASAAEQSFARAIALAPQDAALHSNRGNALQALGRLEESLTCYARALELAPDRPETHLNLGNAYRKQGLAVRAAQAYAEVVRLRPDWPTGHLALAMSLAVQGRHQESLESSRQALQLDPNLSAAWTAQGNSLRWFRKFAEVTAAHERAAMLAPERPELWVNLAEALADEGRLDETERALRRAVELAPHEAPLQAALGAALQKCGRLEEARASFEELVRLVPSLTEAWRLAAIARMRRDPPAAVEAFEKALALDDQDAQTWVNYSGVLFGLQRRDESLAAVLKAQALAPDDENVAYVLSIVRGTGDAPVPSGILAQMFDDYAEKFDQHLVGSLKYHAPTVLRQAVDRVLANPGATSGAATPAPPWRMIDAGCGTGLCGEAFRDLTKHLTGIDLAPKMLVQARQRGIYAELEAGDAVALIAARESAAELVVAGDMVIYVGDLAPLFSACRRALVPGGLLTFSTELDAGDHFTLGPAGRFRHSESHVRRTAAAVDFDVLSCEDFQPRRESGAPVPGQAFVLRRR